MKGAAMQVTAIPKYIYLYFLCQSINLTAAVISVAVAAVVGNLIAPNESWATLPYGMQFLFILLATYPVSILMEKKGRKFGFVVGAIGLAGAGISGYLAVLQNSFWLLLLAHSLLGCFVACANYYRFAAVDNLTGKVKSKAVSFVIAGGLVAGIIGPFISSSLRDIEGFPLFSLCYGVLILLALLNLLLIQFLPKETLIKAHKKQGVDVVNARRRLSESASPMLLFTIVSVALSFGIMNLVMVQSSLKMHHMHVMFDHSAMAIQWHVIAMFAPSFVSGYLITKFGHQKVIGTGLLLFLVTFLVNVLDDSYSSIVVSLIFLGLAWNLAYVGGSAYIAVLLEGNEDAKRLQGAGDTGIAILAMLGAMLPAVLMSLIGWQGTNLFAIGLVVSCLVAQLFLLGRNQRKSQGEY
ncbi:MFS transporter [Marinomonas transparens]|uniref:MFS transporter n=1 Tax=Marinomonas transparens TaxID=2795388 RepID=A0A934N155_9GAMM|nr:MFS transporter [Marinomonas transparens]MBJ7537412.1 MFS transporter [Marinomonas transparens]